MADISMYGRNPLRSVADYQRDYQQVDAGNQTLQANALAMQEKQRANAESNALREAMRNGLDLRSPQGQTQALQIALNAAGPVIKSLGDAAKTGAETLNQGAQTQWHTAQAGKANMETQALARANIAARLRQAGNPEAMAAVLKEAFVNGHIGSGAAYDAQVKQLQESSGSPQGLEKLLAQYDLSATDAKTRAEIEARKAIEDPKQKRAELNSVIGMDGKPNEAYIQGSARIAQARAPVTYSAPVEVNLPGADGQPTPTLVRFPGKGGPGIKAMVGGVEARPKGAVSDAMTPEALDTAAERYRTDGTLPPNTGRGSQGAALTVKILNKAAEKAAAAGDTPESQRIAQLSTKASAAALNQLAKQEAMVGAYERQFLKNADITAELSKKVDRTGSPIVNKWINAGKRAVVGDPDLSAYDASIKAVVNEFTKIVSGAMGNAQMAQAEIKRVEGLLNAAQNQAQVTAVIDLMKRETQNRMTGFKEQKKELTGSMLPTQAKKDAAPVAPKPSVSNW